MHNLSPTLDHALGASNTAVGRVNPLAHPLHQWWHRLPADTRSQVWSGALGAVAVIGILLAFLQVVQGIAERAELRNKATVVQAAAVWRCNALPDHGASVSCRQLLKTAGIDTAIQTRTATIALN